MNPADTDSASTSVRAGAETIRTEAAALSQLADGLGQEFAAAAQLMHDCRGRVIVSGMGKSGHIGTKIAATLASTGTPAFFVHPSEAGHGDLGMITRDDVCLVMSNSGETAELHALLAYVARFSIPMIAITRSAESTLARQADVALLLPDAPEACSVGMAPTTSTTCTLALGDALAVAVMRMRGFRKEDFHVFHPGGKLGAQFLRVRDIMHSGKGIPAVPVDADMGDVLIEMSAKGLGVAAVLDGDILYGIITDGDLRRNMDGLLGRDAGETATREPTVIAANDLVAEAMARMSERKLNALPVVDEEGRLQGIVHVHDCLRAGAR